MFYKKDSYRVLGLMSGTSLDGLDLAVCVFKRKDQGWAFEIEQAATMPHETAWLAGAEAAFDGTAAGLAAFHASAGTYFGTMARKFLQNHHAEVDFIASHGQTIFHEPRAGYTFQAGNGAALAVASCLPVVCDFRSGDVALGGQGAPLVPVGDELLFGQYSACLNLGGFANVSYRNADMKRIAFDICPANMALNYLAREAGLPFDENGRLAASGMTDEALLSQLLALDYFSEAPPKSLGREWFERNFRPLIDQSLSDIPPKLRTVCELIALTVAGAIPGETTGNGVLITGGGAHNAFLIECIRHKLDLPLVVPEKMLIDYKEALVFAFLGVLFFEGQPNCLASATGALRDHCGGAFYLP
jgi:anhydro-N-acetylmuramic acid kinase